MVLLASTCKMQWKSTQKCVHVVTYLTCTNPSLGLTFEELLTDPIPTDGKNPNSKNIYHIGTDYLKNKQNGG